MKKMIILILLFSVFPAVGQNATISLNPFNKATLTMRDGSKMEGYARFNLTNSLVFKTAEDAEKNTYDEQTVSRLTLFLEEGEEKIYDYKVVEGKNNGTLAMLELVEAGSLNLYLSRHTAMVPTGMGPMVPVEKILYYFSRNGEDIATRMKNPNTRSRKFRRVATEFVGNCPMLMSKLNNKEFKRGGIEEVVEFYNTECKEVGI